MLVGVWFGFGVALLAWLFLTGVFHLARRSH
jgi:hypothetical protein